MTLKERKKVFENWLHDHKGVVFKVIRAYSNNDQDSQDLFQDISLQMWNSISNFRGDSSVATWIYKVAIYTALAWVKKEKKQIKTSEEFSPKHLIHATEANHDQQLEWIYKQIYQLNEVDRSLILLWLDEFSYKEIAGILGISESNVGVKINRIKQYLTEKLQNQNHEH